MRERLLHMIADAVCRRPRLIVLTAGVVAIVCAIYAALSLRLNANLDDLIAHDRPFMADYRRFLEDFGDLEAIIIAVDASHNRDAAERAVDALLPQLRAVPALLSVHGSIEQEELARVATRALSNDELRSLALASQAIPTLRTGEVASIIAHASALLAQLIEHGGSLTPDQQQRATASAMLLLESLVSRRVSPNASSVASLPSRRYLTSDSGKLLFISVVPRKDYATLAVIEQPLKDIRSAVERVRREFPCVEIGVTGKPVMQFDEVATSNRDMMRATIIALVLCGVLFMVMMNGVRRPLLAMLAFGIAAAWTHGYAALVVGQLNLLSLVFMLVLIGVGLDYGVHVINRYQEALARGLAVVPAIARAVSTAVRGNITGALTSSVVFFMALATTFQGLRELGIIAGGGLLLCLVAMSVVLPSLLILVETRTQTAEVRAPPNTVSAEPGVNALYVKYPGTVLMTAAAITLLAVASILLRGGPGGRFDDNLLNLQATGLESVKWEHRVLEDSAAASWFGAVIAPTQGEALEAVERARSMPSIGMVRSVFDVVRPDTPDRIAWRGMLQMPTPDGTATLASTTDLDPTTALLECRQRLTIIAQAATAIDEHAAARFRSVLSALNAINIDHPDDWTRLEHAAAETARLMELVLGGDRMSLHDALPAAMRDQLTSANGSFLVTLHPRENVWDYHAMSTFIADLRLVDAAVTGVPITHFESLGEMRWAFVTMSLLALLAIVGVLAVDFCSLASVVLGLTPLALGGIWTLAAMRWFGIPFNLANFFAVPMLIGLSVDSAVHMLHRSNEGESREGRLNFGRTRRAVILTSLTTIIGFGALILAQHRGLRSLGMVMAIGSAACMLASVYVLPALLAFRESRSLPAK